MCYGYYIQKSFVIDYISVKGQICKIVTNTSREKRQIDIDTPDTLDKVLIKKPYIKMIYEKKTWVKDKYQTKYEAKLRKQFPEIRDIIKIYKDSIAWSKKIEI